MSAGLPGLGLGGLFFILSALYAPIPELARSLRGRSDAASRRRVGRQFAIAIAMIVAVDLALRLVYALLELSAIAEGPEDPGLTVLPLVPIAITTALLALVLASAKAAQIAATLRSRGLPPLIARPLPGRARVLGVATSLTAVWFALLAFGAAQLSPVSSGGGTERSEALEADGSEIGSVVPEIGSVVPEIVRAASGEGSAATDPTARAAKPRAAEPSAPVPGDVRAPSGSAPDALAAGDGAVQAPAGTGSLISEESPGTPAPQAETAPQGQGASPAAAGPPDDSGPPEHSSAPEQTGPPAHAGPSMETGPKAGSTAAERAGAR